MHSAKRASALARRTAPAVKVALVLVALHFALFALVVTNSVYYDSGGVIGLLWWLAALWVLPILALVILLMAGLRRWLQRRDRGGE